MLLSKLLSKVKIIVCKAKLAHAKYQLFDALDHAEALTGEVRELNAKTIPYLEDRVETAELNLLCAEAFAKGEA